MGLFNHFPYTNFHELNIDWLLNRVKILEEKVKTLEELNSFSDDNTFVIHAELGSTNEQGGSASIDCDFDTLALAIQNDKRPVLIANFLGAKYNNKIIYPYVNMNSFAQNKIILSWNEIYDFTFASSNHSTCKVICHFLEIEKSGTTTYVSYPTMSPTIGG